MGEVYEDQEGDFSYSIATRRSARGEVTWTWQVRHAPTGQLVDAGTSLRSHRHAKTAAFECIARAGLKDWAHLGALGHV